VQIKKGDEIKLVGTSSRGAMARVDMIAFYPKNPNPTSISNRMVPDPRLEGVGMFSSSRAICFDMRGRTSDIRQAKDTGIYLVRMKDSGEIKKMVVVK
jgi:hypothetical protein